MAIIKSISNLKNKSNEISSLGHLNQEPIFITKNGGWRFSGSFPNKFLFLHTHFGQKTLKSWKKR